jgi:hypothetical protein
MSDRRYDVLVYRDLTDTVNGRELAVDEDGALLGAEFGGLRVAAVGAPIHESKHATIILAAGGSRIASELDAFLARGTNGRQL